MFTIDHNTTLTVEISSTSAEARLCSLYLDNRKQTPKEQPRKSIENVYTALTAFS